MGMGGVEEVCRRVNTRSRWANFLCQLHGKPCTLFSMLIYFIGGIVLVFVLLELRRREQKRWGSQPPPLLGSQFDFLVRLFFLFGWLCCVGCSNAASARASVACATCCGINRDSTTRWWSASKSWAWCGGTMCRCTAGSS